MFSTTETSSLTVFVCQRPPAGWEDKVNVKNGRDYNLKIHKENLKYARCLIMYDSAMSRCTAILWSRNSTSYSTRIRRVFVFKGVIHTKKKINN